MKNIILICLMVITLGILLVSQDILAQATLTRVYQQVGFYQDGKPKWDWINVEIASPEKQKPSINYSYEKRLTATGFEIWYVSTGCTKKVNSDKPNYLKYVQTGYEVKEKPYVEKVKTIDQLKAEANTKAEFLKRAEFETSIWESSQQKKDLDKIKDDISVMTKTQLEGFLK